MAVLEPGGARTVGNPDILRRPKIGLLCSVQCPGGLILAGYDLAQRLREAGVTVAGGFHSPMEQECLRILLRSTNAVVWCLARGMPRRMPPEFGRAVLDGRLLVVAPFGEAVRRPTRATCAQRNRAVAEMSEAVVAVHAAPGSKVETLCRELAAAGKPLYTFAHPANAALLAAGARAAEPGADWRRILAAPAPPGREEPRP